MWHTEYGLYKTLFVFYGTIQCLINSDDGILRLPRSGVSNQAQQHTLQCTKMRIMAKTSQWNALVNIMPLFIGKMPCFTPAQLHTREDILHAAEAT